MAGYFNWISKSVYAKENLEPPQKFPLSQPGGSWFIIRAPKIIPTLPSYTPSTFPVNDISTNIINDLRRDLHFTMKMENTGDEGLYGLLHYCQLPDLELGLDIDLAAFLAGAISCTLVSLYLDDIYPPRKLMAWWPTRWFFNFVEEGMYLGRTIGWFANALVIMAKTFYRAVYGGISHTLSRMIYYWIKKLVTGSKVPYMPLVDDTYAAILSGYLWTCYTLETEKTTVYDRIIHMGWTAIFTGLLEYSLFQYFQKDPPPGLYRWLFGGAFFGKGVWQYLDMENNKSQSLQK